MKKIILFFALFATTKSLLAQVKMPQPSTTQTIKQDFGVGSIELTYSRPGVKGRKIFGDHEPYNALWRTGANGATKIKFSEAVTIGGKKLDSGTYVIYTIPNKDIWEVIINKGLTNWGTNGYDEKQDVVKFKVPVTYSTNLTETMYMQFVNIKPETCELQITWEYSTISIPLTTDFRDKLRASIEKDMTSEKKPFYNAAQFYFEYDKNNVKALETITAAVEANKKAFWMFLYKAKIEKAMGKNAEAKTSATTALNLAKDAKNDTYVNDSQALIDSLK